MTSKLLLLILTCALLPLFLSDYTLFLSVSLIGWAIALFGLNFVMGLSGRFTLGSNAFMLLGLYTATISINSATGALIALTTATAIGALAGLLFGRLTTSLEQASLAAATIALALAFPPLLKHPAFEPLTGGVQGLHIQNHLLTLLPFQTIPLSDTLLFWLASALLLLTALTFHRIKISPLGPVSASLQHNHMVAQAIGINTANIKTLFFSLSGAFCSLAGALIALTTKFASPDSFDLFTSISLLVGLTIGGLSSTSGPIIGSLFLFFVPDLVAEYLSKTATWALYGLLLILAVFLFPKGITGSLHRLPSTLRFLFPKR